MWGYPWLWYTMTEKFVLVYLLVSFLSPTVKCLSFFILISFYPSPFNCNWRWTYSVLDILKDIKIFMFVIQSIIKWSSVKCRLSINYNFYLSLCDVKITNYDWERCHYTTESAHAATLVQELNLVTTLLETMRPTTCPLEPFICSFSSKLQWATRRHENY